MRVNVYAEEMTDQVQLIKKTIDGVDYTGIRFYLALPVTIDGVNITGPFILGPGGDDSLAVTIWGKAELAHALRKALRLLDEVTVPVLFKE